MLVIGYQCLTFYRAPTTRPALFALLKLTVNQMLYAAIILYAVFSPSVLVAGGFAAVVVVETLSSVSKSPITSLVDAAVRHSFGGDG